MTQDIKYFQNVMEEISEANSVHGVNVRGNKKYLEVAKRVEIFRKHYGTDVSITTEIVHLGMTRGEPVVIRAVVAKDLMPIATGTAWEVVGDGNVNRASALENAETSAIGRALACLGLHGGEFASLNEMERIGEKPNNPTTEALMDAWEQAILDQLPDDPAAETLADAYADAMESEMGSYKSARGLDGYKAKHDIHIRFVEEHSPERYGPLKAAYLAHRKALTERKAA